MELILHWSLLVGLFLVPIAESAQPGTPVKDEKVFQLIRERYNGEWIGGRGGDVSGEVLKDGTILVHFSGQLAEFMFYAMPSAKEEIQYIPPSGGGSWLNYFNRSSPSIVCGLSSYDLKVNPFPDFKCRFTVDAQGNLKSFLDRNTLNAISKPEYSSGWENEQRDFQWRTPKELKGQGGATTADIQRSRAAKLSFKADFTGALARAVFQKLAMPAVEEHFGPGNVHLVKNGKSIRCMDMPKMGLEESFMFPKCFIAFDYDGTARSP